MQTDSIIASNTSHTIEKTTCCYCGVGCGVDAIIEDGQLISVKGDKSHPANAGKLCVKGATLHETQQLTNRLLTPLINGKSTDWDTALTHAATTFSQIIEQHGADSVAFYLSGQLLTEDYYVANKLMKGFVGTANVDTNSRLCMSSAVAAHKRAFGEDIVAGAYADLEQTNLIILAGSNMAYTHPIVYQRIVKAKANNPNLTVVVLDPRRTPTCDVADIHLALRPGSDAFFFNGMLSYLVANNCVDTEFVERYCNDFEAARDAATAQVANTAQAAQYCDVDESALTRVYDLFAKGERAVTVFSQGINQSSSGVDKGNAIINCHLASGKIGKPGCAPFSITGQPNAMGGREVGGLSNQLAAHMGYESEEHIDCVSRFWHATNMASKPGLKAIDMFDAVREGKIKAIWIMATNPAVSMPNANRVREALEACELVIVSDCVGNTDTAALANIVFPTTTWGEKTGTVTNSERCISLQKGFLPAPGDAKNDWEIITLFAEKMGFGKYFNYTTVADIFREHAALSGFENLGTRAFDISSYAQIDNNAFTHMTPFYWPVDQGSHKQEMFSDGHFFTPNHKANFIAVKARMPFRQPEKGQLILNTGRVRDQWHTMSRTGCSDKLVGHTDEPYVELHPDDARDLRCDDESLIVLSNGNDKYIGRVTISNNVRPGDVFAPIHWNSRFAANSCISAVVNPVVDPISGQPEFKQSPVNAAAFNPAWEALLINENDFTPKSQYWVKIPVANGYKFRMAGQTLPQDWGHWLRESFPAVHYWGELFDSHNQHFHATGYIGDRLSIVVLISVHGSVKSNENKWLESKIGCLCSTEERYALLAGVHLGLEQDAGKTICSCYQVGEKTIINAINEGCDSAASLGDTLKCGTNCGSCIPELNTLIEKHNAVLAR